MHLPTKMYMMYIVCIAYPVKLIYANVYFYSIIYVRVCIMYMNINVIIYAQISIPNPFAALPRHRCSIAASGDVVGAASSAKALPSQHGAPHRVP